MTKEKREAQPRAQPDRLPPPRIDWRAVITDVRSAGCSLHRIATHIGVEYSTAQRWTHLREDIGYGYGRSLLRLHARYCGAALTLQRLEAADDCAYTSRLMSSAEEVHASSSTYKQKEKEPPSFVTSRALAKSES